MKPGDFVRVIDKTLGGLPRREGGYQGVILANPRDLYSHAHSTDDWVVEIFSRYIGDSAEGLSLLLTYKERSLEVIRTAEEVEEFLEEYL